MLTALKSINFGLAPCLPHSQCVQEYRMDRQSVLLIIPIYAENFFYVYECASDGKVVS